MSNLHQNWFTRDCIEQKEVNCANFKETKYYFSCYWVKTTRKVKAFRYVKEISRKEWKNISQSDVSERFCNCQAIWYSQDQWKPNKKCPTKGNIFMIVQTMLNSVGESDTRAFVFTDCAVGRHRRRSLLRKLSATEVILFNPQLFGFSCIEFATNFISIKETELSLMTYSELDRRALSWVQSCFMVVTISNNWDSFYIDSFMNVKVQCDFLKLSQIRKPVQYFTHLLNWPQ